MLYIQIELFGSNYKQYNSFLICFVIMLLHVLIQHEQVNLMTYLSRIYYSAQLHYPLMYFDPCKITQYFNLKINPSFFIKILFISLLYLEILHILNVKVIQEPQVLYLYFYLLITITIFILFSLLNPLCTDHFMICHMYLYQLHYSNFHVRLLLFNNLYYIFIFRRQ